MTIKTGDLTPGSMYQSVKYGLVEFTGIVPDRTTVSGRCYKFKTDWGNIKYIRPGELKAFLKEEQ